MFTLPKPPFVSQTFGVVPEPLCWAAALSSWQGGAPNRRRQTVPELEQQFSAAIVPESRGALNPKKFDIVASAASVKFAWRVIGGADFAKWNHELLLEMCGLIYVIAFPKGGNPAKDFSHARVIYGAWREMGMTYAIDPISNDTAWECTKIKAFTLIVGLAAERVPLWQTGWVRV